MSRRRYFSLMALSGALACSDDDPTMIIPDSGPAPDAGLVSDFGVEPDLGVVDTGVIVDLGTPDLGPDDLGTVDVGTPDAGPLDMGDAGTGTVSAGIWAAGVNLSGGEFGSGVGTLERTYTYPRLSHAQSFLDAGFSAYRIPFKWERIQRERMGPLYATDLARLNGLTRDLTAEGAIVILDVHNYARGFGSHIGTDTSSAAFADLWRRLAEEFKDEQRVWFGIMNEPSGISAANWLPSANAAIAAIRATGATNMILVPGVRWTGAHSWYSGGEDSNANVMVGVVDPGDNFAFEVHQYLDSDSSGTHFDVDCVSPTVGESRVTRVTEWARMHGYRLFLGEFAGVDMPVCQTAIDGMLRYMRNSSDVWIGYTWWAAGPWWPSSYGFRLPGPQEQWLLPYR